MVTELVNKVVQKILPEGAEITKNPLDVPSAYRFWLIPGQNGPRWLIPQEKKYGLFVFKQWRPFKNTSLIKWKIINMAYYTGRLGLIPGVKSVGIVGDFSKACKQFDWNREPGHIPIIYFGTPSSTHKAIIILIEPNKLQPSLICKVPLSDLAAESIKREYKILNYLKHINPELAPTPLCIDEESGTAIQEAVVGRPLPRAFSNRHREFLGKLSFSKNTTSVFEHSQRLLNTLYKDDELTSNTKFLIERLLKECQDSASLPQIFIHGDFTPWNIRTKSNGRLIAFDWEMGDSNGLPFYDFIYFFLIQSYLFNEKFKSNRIFKLLPEFKKKYPLKQILKFTAASLGLRLAREEPKMDYLENFLQSIR